MKKKILIFGGTRFVGKKVLKLLNANVQKHEIFVASRRQVNVKNFIEIDRKNRNDLLNLFSKYEFDTVVDFINFSALDTADLLSVLKKLNQEPHIISISTTYVYSNPNQLKENKIFIEGDFDPQKFEPDIKMDSEWDYSKGKQSMEAYLIQNYPVYKSTIIRFPVILGEDDYTKRTYYFQELIMRNQPYNFSERGKKSNYIFSQEAAEAIIYFINTSKPGIFNVGMEEAINEEEIFEEFCNFYGKEKSKLMDLTSDSLLSPFYVKYDFMINIEKFKGLYIYDNNFKTALQRELKLMRK